MKGIIVCTVFLIVAPCVAQSPPNLISPINGEYVDNGCIGGLDSAGIHYIWSAVAGATKYHLQEFNPNDMMVWEWTDLEDTSLKAFGTGWYVVEKNRFGWTWQVRAYANATWTGWSDIGTYHYEPLNTDCSGGWTFTITTGSDLAGVHVGLYGLIDMDRPSSGGPYPPYNPLFQISCYGTDLCKGWGPVPAWANGLEVQFYLDWAMNGTFVAAAYECGRWICRPLGPYIHLVIEKSQLELPIVCDTNGYTDSIFMAINLEDWLAARKSIQSEYYISDGLCSELPGYLIGTTPIIYDSLAPPGENPFSTTVFTGTLYLYALSSLNPLGFGCGDTNADYDINVSDAVFLISYVFKGGAAPYPICVGDANGDGSVNVADAVHLINYIFKGGPPPVEDCCL